MSIPFHERRRSPRVALSQGGLITRTSVPVRIIDISAGGVLLTYLDQPHHTGTLNLVLAGMPFSAAFERRRVALDKGAERRIAGVFVDMSGASRGALETFLRGARRT